MKRGDRFVAYQSHRPYQRLYIEVTRMAKDGSWADISVSTWAVQWRKRQPLKDGKLPAAEPYEWDRDDFIAQEADHMAMLAEKKDLASILGAKA